MTSTCKVLIAEDNKINQIVAAGALKRLGHTSDVVGDGAAAVASCIESAYDAVLMDVMMPGMDGYQATACIRQHERTMGLTAVPIIGLSARAMEGDREIALAAGFNDYLTKPLRDAALADALARWVGTPAHP